MASFSPPPPPYDRSHTVLLLLLSVQGEREIKSECVFSGALKVAAEEVIQAMSLSLTFLSVYTRYTRERRLV